MWAATPGGQVISCINFKNFLVPEDNSCETKHRKINSTELKKYDLVCVYYFTLEPSKDYDIATVHLV